MKRKFGENYCKCEIFDKQKRKIISILNSRQQITLFKIVITSDSLDIYVENVIKGKETKMLEEIISIIEMFRAVTTSSGIKNIEIENVTLSKGDEIADKEYEKRVCGKPVDMVEDNVGISLRYVSRQTIPLVIYSYLINYADKRRFFEDTANYVHILADANI